MNGTEALAAIIMHSTKLVAYGSMATLTGDALVCGLLLGPILIVGSFLGKRLVDRVSEPLFPLLVDGTPLIAGITFLSGG